MTPNFNSVFTARYNVWCWKCGGTIAEGEKGLTSTAKDGYSGPSKHMECEGPGGYPGLFSRRSLTS